MCSSSCRQSEREVEAFSALGESSPTAFHFSHHSHLTIPPSLTSLTYIRSDQYPYSTSHLFSHSHFQRLILDDFTMAPKREHSRESHQRPTKRRVSPLPDESPTNLETAANDEAASHSVAVLQFSIAELDRSSPTDLGSSPPHEIHTSPEHPNSPEHQPPSLPHRDSPAFSQSNSVQAFESTSSRGSSVASRPTNDRSSIPSETANSTNSTNSSGSGSSTASSFTAGAQALEQRLNALEAENRLLNDLIRGLGLEIKALRRLTVHLRTG